MSVAEVTDRIDQLRSHLATLSGLAGAAGTQPGNATSGAAFAQTLASSAAGLAGTGSTSSTPAAARLGGTGSTGGAAGDAVVAQARRYLGVPYVWGGTNPASGLDCSGLVQLVYHNVGIDLPRVSSQQATAGRPVADLAHAAPGDILAFGSPVHHVGIYIGNHKMIEAPHTGEDVRVSNVYETPSAIRRVLPPAGAARVAGVAGVAGSAGAGAGTPYASLFQRAGARYGVSPSLLSAVAAQESGFNARAVSGAGAQGLMQLMPSTAARLGVSNAFDPAQAVDGAARLLRDLHREFGRSDLALAAYNAGPGAVHRYGGIPPYPETQSYVRSVLGRQAALEAR